MQVIHVDLSLDMEWLQIQNGIYTNKSCGHIFKNKEENIYNAIKLTKDVI